MATAMDPNLLGVRDTLNKQFGIDNNRIGYNTNNGMVQVDGQDVFKPQTNINGTTYASQDQFNSIGGKLNNMNQQHKLMDMATNPQGLNPYGSQVSDLVNQLKTMNGQAPVSMQDVYGSPQYAAARAQQDYNAQQATRQAQEALGESGFGRSTNLADRAQQIQNDKSQFLMTQAAPQILQAMQSQRQQQMNNVANLLSSLSGLNNQANETAFNQQSGAQRLLDMLNQQQQFQTQNKLAEAGLTGQYNGQQTLAGQQAQLQHDEAVAGLTGQYNGSPTFQAQQAAQQNAIARAQALGVVDNPQDAAILGVPVGTTTREMQALMNDMAYKNAELGLRSQANGIAAQRANTQEAMDKSRAGYYDSQVAKNNEPPKPGQNDKESAYVSSIDQMTPDNRAAFFKNEKSGIIKDVGTAGYNALYNMYFDQYGNPKG